MIDNDIWNIVKLPKGVKPRGCKWIFITKNYLNGNVEIYKVCLVAKDFSQKEDINYK